MSVIKEIKQRTDIIEAQETYKDIIEHLDIILRRVRHILSKFIHGGSDKLKQTPLRQDVELEYFLTLFIVRRSSYRINESGW